jgi:hypothetical protein
MATDAPPKRRAKHETWLDWMPYNSPMPQLLSHDELLSLLRSRGTEITSAGLQYYRHRGILPRPIRRQHAGKVRPVYPVWFVPAIETLKELQGLGWSLDEIKPHLKVEAGVTYASPEDILVPHRVAMEAAARLYAHALITEFGLPVAAIRFSFLDDAKNEINFHETEYAPD